MRWSSKRIPGRSLFYCGEVGKRIEFYGDYSGVKCIREFSPECDCKADCLIPAPEDAFLRGKISLEMFRCIEAGLVPA